MNMSVMSATFNNLILMVCEEIYATVDGAEFPNNHLGYIYIYINLTNLRDISYLPLNWW